MIGIDLMNNSNIMSAFIDTVKMKLFGTINTGNKIIDTFLSTMAIGTLTYITRNIYSKISQISFNNIINAESLFSLFYKKNSIELEGRKSNCISAFQNSQVISTVFSDRFKAVWSYIIENIENNDSIYKIKEYYSNNLNFSYDLYIVSQNRYFKIDKNIYAHTFTEEIESSNKESRSEIKTDKIKIILYSYTLTLKEMTKYVDLITNEYLKNIKNSRKNVTFIYTLNKTKFENYSDECWNECVFDTVKTFDNTFFDEKKYLLDSLNFFINNKKWYYEKGRPYTLGIALHGPPGTGKTSIIKAIANMTKRHIIILSFKIIKTRSQLNDFFFESTYNSNNDKKSIGFDKKILVIEDIDCIGDIILDRNRKKTDRCKYSNNNNNNNIKIGDILQSIVDVNVNDANGNSKNNTFKDFNPDDRVTLDDILNLWDGINETSGRILIISSNHYDKLDPALIRPGRIDIPLELGNASHQTISEIYTHYYGDKICKKKLNKIQEYKYTPAAIVNMCISCKTGDELFKKLIK